MIFSNARLIFPDGIRDGLELVVEIGKIAEIRQRSVAESTDLGGNYLAPGFIDLHIHGALGRDTMERTAEAIRQICAHHASGGTSDASDLEARAGFEYGMGHVTHAFNAMSSAHRNGIYREAGLLEFALSEPKIVCELIADGHHVSPTLVKLLYRAKGPRGICLVTDATAGTGLSAGKEFSLGGRSCVVGDGVCLLADRSALAGSSSRMIDLVRVMVDQVGVPLHEAVAMATANPARALGLTTKGKLEAGADADLVVLSPQLEVAQTFVDGEQIFLL